MGQAGRYAHGGAGGAPPPGQPAAGGRGAGRGHGPAGGGGDRPTGGRRARDGLPDVDQAWQRFLTKYYPCEPLALAEETPGAPGMAPPAPPAPEGAVRPRRGRNVRWLTRAALAAAAIAALLLATTVTASAFGYDLWGVIAEWSKETFTFTANDRADRPAPDAHQAGASADPGEAEYSSLQDALDSYGISTPLAPAWIPERFELDSVTVGETSALMLLLHIT